MLILRLRSLLTCLLVRISASAYSSSSTMINNQHRSLPSSAAPLIIGYASNANSGKADQAIIDGASVIIWSFIHLNINDDDKTCNVKTSLDLNEIQRIRDKYKHVVHLAAFGGWNGPHPPTFSDGSSLSGEQWCEIFMQFNEENGYLFDGIDWDYEGNDNLDAPTSMFTLETLDIMADFSKEAKLKDLIVSMAPAESYLDAAVVPDSIDATFSLRLDLPPRAWTSPEDREIIKGFSHAGRQCYAYVLAKAGVESFDFISIQLYEGYAPYVYEVTRRGQNPVDAIMERVNGFVGGYVVNGMPLSSSPEFEVKIPLSKLVIGIGNRWCDGVKFCRIKPSSLKSVFDRTKDKYGEGFSGIMFWTVEEEGNDAESRMANALKKEFEDLHPGEIRDEL